MRDDEIRRLLREVNPWWRAAISGGDVTAWARDDRTLRLRAAHDLGYRSPVLADLVADPLSDALVLLRGPRRVGKSVALKDLAVSLCLRPDVIAWQVIYLPADTLTERDFRRAFQLGRDTTRPAGERPRVWLIDEVTAVPGWTRTIKSLRDNSPVGGDTVVLTGSSATGVAEADRDLGAGRAGEANLRRRRLLLPMSFADIVRHTLPDVPVPAPVGLDRLQSPEAGAVVDQMEAFTDDLDLAWQRYLEHGGFPRAVAEHVRQGAVSMSFAEDLLAWLRADVDPEGTQESVPLLLDTVHSRSGAPLNVRATAEALGFTRSYVDRRLARLVSAFAALWCPQRDDDGRPIPGSQAKFYLSDPLLTQLPHLSRPGLAPRDATRLTEAALGVLLAAAVDHTSPGRWTDGDTIGYARTRQGNEIDFGPLPVARWTSGVTATPVEAKWVSSGWRAEARTIEGRFGRGIIATKTVTDRSHPSWAVPAPVLALLIG